MEDNEKYNNDIYNNHHQESEIKSEGSSEFEVNTKFRDIEILALNDDDEILIARGRRYGRMWLLKGVRPDAQDSEGARARLLNEYEVLSRFHDPGVVSAVGVEEIEGLGLCIVEEWVEGTGLDDLIRNSNLTPKVKAGLMHDIIRNVEYVNDRGVEHGKINLSNVIVRQSDGSVVLMGFGSSKLTTDFRNDVAGLGEIMQQLGVDNKKLASRCLSLSDTDRPKDASEVRRMYDRRKRYSSVLAGIMGGILVVVLVMLGGTLAIRTKEASTVAKEQLASLERKNIKEQDHIMQLQEELQRMGEMEDSLNNSLEFDRKYSEKLQSAYSEGCRQIDKAIEDYDKNVFPKFEKNNADFYESVVSLQKKLMAINNRATYPKDFKEIREEDAHKLRIELIDHEILKVSEFYRGWLQKLNSGESVSAEEGRD